MKKGLVLGLLAGAAATAAAVVYFKKKQNDCCYYDDDIDADLECDSCCGECCDCEEDCNCAEIPAEKAEESVMTTDACIACGYSEEEALDAIVEPVESDEV